MVDSIDLVYVETETKVLGPIWSSAACDVMETKQDNDVTDYASVVYVKNVIMIDWTEYGLWRKPDNKMTWLII